MGFLTDLLKEVPLSAVLKEKIAAFEYENASLKTENAILKDDKRQLEREVMKLKEEIGRLTHTDDLHETEQKILVIAKEGRELFAHSLAERLGLPEQRTEYFLLELVAKGYLDESFGYPINQKGRKYLLNNGLL